jgi:hypothetical protein
MAHAYTLSADNEINPNGNKPLFGSIFTKNIVTKTIQPLSSSLSIVFDKYPTNIKREIYNNVIDFNVYDDFIWIRTLNYMVFDRIAYSKDSYVDSGTTLNYIKNSKYVSDPFIFEQKDYCLVASLSLLNLNTINNQKIVPIIKKFSFNEYILIDVYNGSDLDKVSLYDTGLGRTFKYKYVNTPRCFYNTRNNIYGMLGTIEDSNGFPSVYKWTFKYNESDITSLSCSMTELYEYDYIKTINLHTNNTLVSAGITFNTINSCTYSIDQSNNSIIFY